MTRTFLRGPQGVRSNRYSGSKFTNWTAFHPWDSAVSRALDRYSELLFPVPDTPLVVVEPTCAEFLLPFDETDLREEIEKVPARFTRGLRAVFVLSGSRKQAKVARRLFCFGTYWLGCVFLAPYPKRMMRRCWKRLPKPSVLQEYRRAGVEFRQLQGGWTAEFTPGALRMFYLRDILMHEIDHHVDRNRSRSKRKCEGFAEWFAGEYGFRLRSGSRRRRPGVPWRGSCFQQARP